MNTFLIIGNDRICQQVVSKINLNTHFKILIDKSTNLKRVTKLIAKRKISPFLLAKMYYCEFWRNNYDSLDTFDSIKKNETLINLVEEYDIKKIVLFRAGLILNKKLIEKKIDILNIHAAIVPKYGGIGSIQKALNEKAFNQYSSLHKVTTTIDKGEILDKEVYTLVPEKSYCYNEKIAYEAAFKLLNRTLKNLRY
jgi:folate-dependent phosphoribosylglycinamide formyltransferase PurN